jgi:hypothetical protein
MDVFTRCKITILKCHIFSSVYIKAGFRHPDYHRLTSTGTESYGFVFAIVYFVAALE